MHACSDWPRPEIHCHGTIASVYTALSPENLHKSQECFSGHWEASPAKQKHHRPNGMITGHIFVYRPKIDGRPALYLADRPKLPAEPAIDSSRGQAVYGMEFQANVCMNTLPIMQWTQGSMALDPRAINHAFQCMMAQKPS